MAAYFLILLSGFVAIIIFAQSKSEHTPAGNEPTPGRYHFFYEKGGITVYLSWIVADEKTTALSFKLVNNNDYPVVVTWKGPQWYSKGISLQTESAVNGKYTFSDGHTLHAKGNHQCTTELDPGMPNYLHFDAPEGEWKPGQLSVTLSNFMVMQQPQYASPIKSPSAKRYADLQA